MKKRTAKKIVTCKTSLSNYLEKVKKARKVLKRNNYNIIFCEGFERYYKKGRIISKDGA